MKKILLLLLVVTLNGFSQVIDFSEYDGFLKKHVSSKGVVDYDKVLKDMREINNIAQNFSKISPNKSWSETEVKTYWINVYNANIIKLLVENYPIKSINYIREPFKMKFIDFDGEKISLDHIEHEILRPMNDPRVHFALYSTAISSPQLKNTAYAANSIDYDLDVATSNYINDTTKNTIGTATCQLSKIFEWYFADFIGPVNMVGFINKYSAIKINDNTKLEFKEYDWNLYK
ncbi:DUF547 domain-containing protein [Flavobacterium jejuense]|uniref:DUF547 domain-containing protein n=1 Tax=Flavobacterium jejuense TaxID=1544455 RepID=A0ABX0IZE2_9FLAO|nr:DUF547 domain-containing protein [Flavobacterium jejuense]NHN28062.1 DUF547 domain-containing protein [Flavobacterium jejuense]